MQLSFNLSDEITDKLESGTVLIYFQTCKSINTQQKVLIKARNEINEIQMKTSWIKMERHLN
jgi:hypothetical protein